MRSSEGEGLINDRDRHSRANCSTRSTAGWVVCGLSPPQPGPDSNSEGNLLIPFLRALSAQWCLVHVSFNRQLLRLHSFSLVPFGLFSPHCGSTPPSFCCLLPSSPTTRPTHSLLSCFLPLQCGQAHSLSPIYQCIGTVAQVLICVCWFFFPVNSGCKGFISLPHSHYIK